MPLCPHMVERTIEHFPTGVNWPVTRLDQHPGESYREGDIMALVCPHGCDPIIVHITADSPEEVLC